MNRSASTREHRSPAAQGAPGAERILIIRLGALGDVVRTLPAASAIRDHYARAHLAWLVEAGSADVPRSQPWIDEVIELPRAVLSQALAAGRLGRLAGELQRFAAGLRARRFDLVLDFHSILKSGVASWWTAAPRRVAFAPPLGREGAWWFAHRRIGAGPGRRSRFARNRLLLDALGIDTPERARPLAVSDDGRRRAAARLREAGFEADAGWAAMHPGSSPHTPHKRWSPEGFGAVARALRAQRGLATAVLAGPGEEERARARAVVEASGGAARLAPPTSGFEDLAASLEAARLFVGGDSGPLHVASLVGTPVVQILGPTHPVENRPWAATPWRRVCIPVACSPCRRGCAAAHCLRVIPPELVARAAIDLFDATRPAGAGVLLAG